MKYSLEQFSNFILANFWFLLQPLFKYSEVVQYPADQSWEVYPLATPSMAQVM